MTTGRTSSANTPRRSAPPHPKGDSPRAPETPGSPLERAARTAGSGLAITLFAALLLTGCTKTSPASSGSATSPDLPPVKTRVATVRVENVPVLTEVTGTVRPVQRATLAAKVMGAIEDVPVTLGQRVSAGDLLVKISAGEIAARLAQAQSQLNAAQRDLERERALLAKGASTADMVKGLEDRFAAGQAMLREAEVMLGYVAIRAPFDGVIARKLVHAGDFASPGLPLLEIEGTTDFEVEAALPDSLAAGLDGGAPLVIDVPAAGIQFTGTLAGVSSAADAAARTVLAKITVPAGTRVRSGQFARVHVPGAPVRALLAPAAAVAPLGQMERVFVADAGNRAVLRLVKTGAARGDRIEILSGLDDGERVVVAPPPGLREQQPLEFLP